MLFISSNVTGIVIRMQSFESTTRGTAFRVKPSIIYFHIFFFFFVLFKSFFCVYRHATFRVIQVYNVPLYVYAYMYTGMRVSLRVCNVCMYVYVCVCV